MPQWAEGIYYEHILLTKCDCIDAPALRRQKVKSMPILPIVPDPPDDEAVSQKPKERAAAAAAGSDEDKGEDPSNSPVFPVTGGDA